MENINTKKILVICPTLPDINGIEVIKQSLSFLSKNYKLYYYDPLDIANLDISPPKYKDYFDLQNNKLSEIIINYDVLIGFSLGGILIQNLFKNYSDLFIKKNTYYNIPIILFSTPSFIDQDLYNKLSTIINLAKDNLTKSLDLYYELIFYPNKYINKNNLSNTKNIINIENIKNRLIHGLNYVLNTDNKILIKKSFVKYIHLIGANSKLVNINNVIVNTHSILYEIPSSGMRVLQDNSQLSQQVINKYI